MKIGLLGYGQMGKMVEKIAGRHGIEVVERYWDEHPLTVNEETRITLKEVSVLIDFSVPEAVVDNIQKSSELSIHMVVGTTGWLDNMGKVIQIVRDKKIGLVHASNFSLGINLFYKIIGNAASLFSAFDQYDPFIEETHHKIKKDAPSGTARKLVQMLEKYYPDREIPTASVRAGYIPGIHRVSFDSEVDTIKLEHNVRNREGFAEGAILAAKWIANKKGLFAFEDVLGDILK